MTTTNASAGEHRNNSTPANKSHQLTKEFVKSVSDFFKRDLISIPLIKSYPHQQISQRCNGLKAATLELDTAAYPNIEYIAGNRLSIYPPNPHEHVQSVMKHIIDDISSTAVPASAVSSPKPPTSPSSGLGSNSSNSNITTNNNNNNINNNHLNKKVKLQPSTTTNAIIGINHLDSSLAKFVSANKSESLRLALTYLYDLTTAPSRDLLRILADCCSNKDHRTKLINISRSDENWERWLCSSLKTLKSTFEEFNSIQTISAKRLLAELAQQTPRQYSISSIKSSKRFRTEIIVVQHKFNSKQIAVGLQNSKERESMQQLEDQQQQHQLNAVTRSRNQSRSTSSVRSLRSMGAFASEKPSPISSQQVHKIHNFSGPLVSMYASSSNLRENSTSRGRSNSFIKNTGRSSEIETRGAKSSSVVNLNDMIRSSTMNHHHQRAGQQQGSIGKLYDGLCSNYLLNLQANESVLCEFVENPRFTLKGNRERPIMMIGQDVGMIAYRPFWQQRALEHDRAQIFYTLFKDLKQKKFGDMQLVCLTGSKCKIEELFRREIESILMHRIISSCQYVNKRQLISLLDKTATDANEADVESNQSLASNLLSQDKELADLGLKMAKLLVDSNGCLYTCCDPQMTQALEILLVESLVKYNQNLSRDRIMSVYLPKWKGINKPQLNPNAGSVGQQSQTVLGIGGGNATNYKNNKILYQLENPFERAQIVQEIYDSTL